MKATLLITAIVFSFNVFSQIQVTEEWVAIHNGPDSLFDIAIAVDVNGDVHVTGTSFSFASQDDIVTIKYDKNGNIIWKQIFNGPLNFSDRAFALTVDAQCNSYVTGKSDGLGWATIKYDIDGNQKWVAGFSALRPNDITVDQMGNVYVTGTGNGTGDMKTVKYDSNGVQQWASTFNGTANLGDEALAVVVDGSGNVYITGGATFTVTRIDITTIKYNSNGIQQWVQNFVAAPTNLLEAAFDIALDSQGDIYVTGQSVASGNDHDFTTIKYNPAGVQQWVQHFDGPTGSFDRANALVIDGNDNIYVTGGSLDIGTGSFDYATIKYTRSGTQEWVQIHDGPANGNDEARDIVVDLSGNVYITGGSIGNGTGEDYATVAYSTDGVFLWEQRFDGSASSLDRANSIDVDAAGNVYVTGQSTGLGTNFDFVTIKYSQFAIIIPPDPAGDDPESSQCYIPNGGQLLDTDGNPVPDILFSSLTASPALFFRQNGLSYVFARLAPLDSITLNDTLHRVDMEFVGSNTNVQVSPVDEVEGSTNYFLGHIPEGVTDLKCSKRLVCPDIYPNIDLVYSNNPKGFRYYLVVQPGGNINDIKIKYTGADKVKITPSKKLQIETPIGMIEQDPVHAIQQLNTPGNPVTPRNVRYVSKGNNQIGFQQIGNAVDPTLPLVLAMDQGHTTPAGQPPPPINLPEWSTYFGGSLQDVGIDVTTDNLGNVYMVGRAESTNLPVTAGAEQGTNLGFINAFLTAFDKDNQLIWATYYGGTLIDKGLGITVTNDNKLYFVGSTRSEDFPVFKPIGNAYQQLPNVPFLTGQTGFIARLNPLTGIADWSTAFGAGAVPESVISIDHDALNNVYIVGLYSKIFEPPCTQCVAPLPGPGKCFMYCNVSSAFNYFQDFYAGPNIVDPNVLLTDGFIAKFNNLGELLLSTSFGGEGDDNINDIHIDDNFNFIYITGSTKSVNATDNLLCGVATNDGFPLCDPGGGAYFDNTGNGGSDAFLSKFNLAGQLIWSTFFGGDLDDEGKSITTNSQGDVYIVGTTKTIAEGDNCLVPTNNGFPICTTGTSYFQSFAGGGDNFIARFSSAGLLKWSTYLGGSGLEIDKLGFSSGEPAIVAADNDDIYLACPTN